MGRITAPHLAIARVDDATQRTLEALEALKALSEDHPRPADLEALSLHRRLLSGAESRIVLAGAAKKGKTSFANALLGRPLLPVAVDQGIHATFEVIGADEESFRMHLEDGSTRNLEHRELAAQALDPDRVQSLEIASPARYLPPRSRLVDPPGFGALHPNRLEIIHREAPRADAVIFVLDSARPMLRDELEYLESLLEVTPNLFFIQTKIDLLDSADWQAVLERNEEILAATFGDRLDGARVWPLSSTNLLTASQRPEMAAAFLEASRFPELEAALAIFLLKVVGWRRVSEAVLVAESQSSRMAGLLADRLNALRHTHRPGGRSLLDDLRRARADFEKRWGPGGSQRRRLFEQIQHLCGDAVQQLDRQLGSEGIIERDLRGRIDALEALGEAQELEAGLSEQMVKKALEACQRVAEETHAKCRAALAAFESETWRTSTGLPFELDVTRQRTQTSLDIEHGLWKRLTRVGREALQSTNELFTPLGTLASLTGLKFVLPAILTVATATFIFETHKKLRQLDLSHLEEFRRRLRDHLEKSLEHTRRQLFEAGSERGTTLEDAFREIAAHFERQVASGADFWLEENRQKIESARLNANRKHRREVDLRLKLRELEEIRLTIRGAQDDLHSLDRWLQDSPSSPSPDFAGSTSAAPAGASTARQEER